MTPAGRNKTVSFIPFLVGSTVASILVLAVVVAIVIARSGGSDVALVSPVAACCNGFDNLRGGAPGFSVVAGACTKGATLSWTLRII